jgi:hypothetical protein
MSEQSERIHAALLRFAAERSTAQALQVKPTEPGAPERQLVVVNEQNLEALFLSSAARPSAPIADRKFAAGKGS